MPHVDDQGSITMISYEPEGSFRTPQFDYNSKPQSLCYVLDLQDIAEEMSDDSNLVISIHSDGVWSYMLQYDELMLYQLQLNHSAAEDVCIKKGGHLASVGSQEEQDKMKSRAFGWNTLLGGRRDKNDDWFWLDGKTWAYQNWFAGTQEGECLTLRNSQHGQWVGDSCDTKMSFICAANEQAISGNHTFVMQKAFLSIPHFRFWWNHNPDPLSRQKKVFQIMWTIEKRKQPDLRQFVTGDISGSIITPGFGSLAPPEFYENSHEYTAVIQLPYNVSDMMGNDTFVVEVDIRMPYDEIELLTMSLHYEFNHLEMDWFDAEAFCVSKGGHLASASTPNDWHRLQEFYAKVLPEGKDYDDFLYVWRGGHDQYLEGRWEWTDRSKWSDEHWMIDEPMNDRWDKDFLQLVASKSTGSEWIAWRSNDTAESICQVPSKMVIRESTQLVFSSENISTVQLTWVGAVGKQHSNHDNDSFVGGFKLKWHLDGANVSNQETKGEETINWKLKKSYENPASANRNMRIVLNLVREAKKHKVSETKIWNSVLKHRWNAHTLKKANPCLSDQVKQTIYRIAQELNLTIGFNGWIPEYDMFLGAKLLSVINDCSARLVEVIKLSVFFESLLTNESLETVVAATMNSIQPRAEDTIKDFTAINVWYEELDKRYDFSMGLAVTGLFTTNQLRQLRKLAPPYLKGVTGSVASLSSQNRNSVGLQLSGT